MGGLALKTCVTKRINRVEFDSLKNELIPIFKQYFNNVVVPRFYEMKETFGDIDILVEVTGNENIQRIIDTFKPNEIFHNGNCWSFDYKEVQIDLMTTSAENFDAYSKYLEFNDLNNLVGKLAHGFGIRLSQEGLRLDYFNNKGQRIGKILLTTNYPKIYTFFGLDPKKWEDGFNTLEEIFEFIVSSPYFDWRRVQLEALNHVNKERDVKRKSYMSFLEWIEKNEIRQTYEFYEDKSKYIDMIDEYFPEANLPTEIRRLEYEYAEKLYIQSKFNGNKITRKFGLEGPELGKAIVGFKQYMAGMYPPVFNNNFNEFILNADERQIWELFKTYLAF